MRVLLITDNPSDGIAFYRSTGPWNQIQKEYDDVILTVKQIQQGQVLTWDFFMAHDVLIISNPRNIHHLTVIKTAKTYGVKTWADYDDNYLDIPKDNQSFNILTSGHVNQMTKECLMEADITTVTTNYMKEYFLPYTTRITVIPNAFPVELLSDNSLGKIEQGSHNFISWRGSNSHEVNLKTYAKEIIEIANNNPDWIFKFFGMNPAKLFEVEMNYDHYDFASLMDSFYRLKRFASKIHIVTLYDRPFNKSKSNIVWMEATISGSVVLAPDWEEWQKPGIVNYTSKEDFKEKLQKLISREYDLTEHFEQSRDYILNNLSLKKINRERLKILQQLSVSQSNYSA